MIFLAADQIPVGQCFKKLLWLENEDEPGAMAYGLYNTDISTTDRFNLKQNSHSSGLKKDDVLTIRYSKQDATVSFTCSTLDYY